MSRFVSVIICTYNRERLLRRTLESLARQTVGLDSFEVIVVDDCSDAEPVSAVQDMHNRGLDIRLLSMPENLGTGEAANQGLEAAKGDCIFFTDDDCIVADDWIERLKEALHDEGIVAGSIASPVSNYFQLCHNIAQFGPFFQGRQAGECGFIPGANMAFTRSVFTELKGFEMERNCAPDMEIVLRARENGFKIYFEPGAVVLHAPERYTFAEVFSYAVEHAATTIVLRNRYRKLLRTPFILRSSILTLIASPIIAFSLVFQYYSKNYYLLKMFHTIPMVFVLKLAWCFGSASGLRKYKKLKNQGSWTISDPEK